MTGRVVVGGIVEVVVVVVDTVVVVVVVEVSAQTYVTCHVAVGLQHNSSTVFQLFSSSQNYVML